MLQLQNDKLFDGCVTIPFQRHQANERDNKTKLNDVTTTILKNKTTYVKLLDILPNKHSTNDEKAFWAHWAYADPL